MHEGFLERIRAEPDQDVHRLVYADFLDEHGDSDRAEFIRLQVRLARGEAAPEETPALRRRERELLVAHELEWTAPLHGIVQRARFVRGFVERVTLLPEGFIQRGEELFRLAPVRHVIITDAGEQLSAIAGCPWLASVETLECRTLAGATTIEPLFASGHLTGLTGLILRFGGIDDSDAPVLAAQPCLARLTTLDLYGCGFGWEGLAALVRSQYLTGVTTLVLNDNDNLDENAAEAFSGSDVRMTGLTTLCLGFTRIGDEGGRGLATSPHLSNLRTLDVNNCGIGPEGAQALVESPILQGLTLLDLRGNALSAGVRKRLRARVGDRVKV
jgi:uncharacterized protein (TIGR02996 family)